MLAFEYGVKRLDSMGLKPNKRLLNRQSLARVLVYFLNVSLNFMFLILEANTFWEYTNSIFVCMAAFVGLVLFMILIAQVGKMFKLIQFARKVVEDSKYVFIFFILSKISKCFESSIDFVKKNYFFFV